MHEVDYFFPAPSFEFDIPPVFPDLYAPDAEWHAEELEPLQVNALKRRLLLKFKVRTYETRNRQALKNVI